MALAMLPVAAWLMRPRRAVVPRLPARAGAILGALACVATSALPSYEHNPFLLNAASGPVTVRVTWLLRDVPCPAPVPSQPVNGSLERPNVAAELAATLTPGDLDDPIAFELQRGQVAALDGPPPSGVSPGGVCTANRASLFSQCVGVVLDAPPAAPVLVVGPGSWRETQDGGCGDSPPPVFQCDATLDPDSDPGPDAVTLKTVGGTLQFVVAGRFSAAPVDLAAIQARTPAPGSCRQVRDDLQQLLAADQPCAIDADCLAYNPPPVLGLPPACGYDVSVSSIPKLNQLEAAWSNACLTTTTSCGLPGLAVCRRGLCAPAIVRDASVEHGGEGGRPPTGPRTATRPRTATQPRTPTPLATARGTDAQVFSGCQSGSGSPYRREAWRLITNSASERRLT